MALAPGTVQANDGSAAAFFGLWSGCTMKSINFEFLRDKHPHLADLGGFAEQYLGTDAPSSLIKLRLFAEMTVNDLYARLGLVQPYDANLNDLLNGQPFRDAVPAVVVTKFHVLRKAGNQAAHEGSGTREIAERALHEAYHLATWVHVAYDGGAESDAPVFRLPEAGGAAGETKARLKQEKKQALQRLATQEAQHPGTHPYRVGVPLDGPGAELLPPPFLGGGRPE